MAGLYIHVPFCAKRCIYCDFFSNTEMKYKVPYLEAIVEELRIRKNYIDDEPIETIYFGGGTPSQLAPDDFRRIFEAIHLHFKMDVCREITLEANPDDMTPAYVRSLRALPFNRISMGVQSFQEKDLRFLNRRHSREQALRAVASCRENGFDNISIDLIYGLPGQTLSEWEENLEEALHLDIPHLSAYHLIYEEGTALYKKMKAGTIRPVDEELSVAFFSTLIDTLEKAGYLHYEISNFARPGYYSQHNSSYWTGKKYLGIGPSAHSYNGENRTWNRASLPLYLEGIRKGKPDMEIEMLDMRTRYNDFIITRLRTMWGLPLAEVEALFGAQRRLYCEKQAASPIRQGLLTSAGDVLRLTPQGIFVSDGIMSDLLWV